jgi:hypothetical protein
MSFHSSSLKKQSAFSWPTSSSIRNFIKSDEFIIYVEKLIDLITQIKVEDIITLGTIGETYMAQEYKESSSNSMSLASKDLKTNRYAFGLDKKL